MGNVHVETFRYGRSEHIALDKKCEDFIPRRKYYPASCPSHYFGVDHREHHRSTHSDGWGCETPSNNNRRVGFDPDWEVGRHPNLESSGRAVVPPLKESHSFNPGTKTLRGYEDYNPFKPRNAQEIESENIEDENNAVAVEWTPDFKSHYDPPVSNDTERNDGIINQHSGLTPILTPSPGSASPIAVYRSGSTFIPVRTGSLGNGSVIGAQTQPMRAFPIKYGTTHSDVQETGVGSGSPRSSGDATPNQVGLSKQSSDTEKRRLGENNFAAEPDMNDTRLSPVKNKTETIIPGQGSFNSGRGQTRVTSSHDTESSFPRLNAGFEKQTNVSELVPLGKRSSNSLISHQPSEKIPKKSSSERKKDGTSMPTSDNFPGKNSEKINKKASPFNTRKKTDSFQGHEVHPTGGSNVTAVLHPDQTEMVGPQLVASLTGQQMKSSGKGRQVVSNPIDYSDSQSRQEKISPKPVFDKHLNNDQPPFANGTALQENQSSEPVAWKQSYNSGSPSVAEVPTDTPAKGVHLHYGPDDNKSNATSAGQAVILNADNQPTQVKFPIKPVQLPHLHRQTRTSNDQSIYSPEGRAAKSDTKSSNQVVIPKDTREPPTQVSGKSQGNLTNSDTPAWSTKSGILNGPASQTSRAFLYNDFFDDPMMSVPSISRRNIAQEGNQEAQQPTVNFEPHRVSKPPTRKASLEVSRPLLPKLVKTLSSTVHPFDTREAASSLANEPLLEKSEGNISRMDSTQALFQRPWEPDKVDSNSGTASPSHRSHGQLNSNERAENFPTRFGSVGKIRPANADITRNDKEDSQSNLASAKAPKQQLLHPMDSQELNSAPSALQPPTVSLRSTPAVIAKEADFSAVRDKEHLKDKHGIESGLPALAIAPGPSAANLKKPVAIVTPSPRGESKESMKSENQLEGLQIERSDNHMTKPRIKQNLTAGRGNRTLGSDDDDAYNLSTGPQPPGQSEAQVPLDMKNETQDSTVPFNALTSAIVNTAIPSISQDGKIRTPSQPMHHGDKTYATYSNSSTKPIESLSSVGMAEPLEFFQPETNSEYYEEETITVVRPAVYNPLAPASSWPQGTDEEQDQVPELVKSSIHPLARQSSGAQLARKRPGDRSPKSGVVIPTTLAQRNDIPKNRKPELNESLPRSGNSTGTDSPGRPSAPTISRPDVIEKNARGIEPLKAFRVLTASPTSLAGGKHVPYHSTAEPQHPHPRPPTEATPFSPNEKIPSAEHLKNQRPLVSVTVLPDVHQPNRTPLDEVDKEDNSEQGRNQPLKFITVHYTKDLEDSTTSIETDTGALPGNTHAEGPGSSIELNALDKFRRTFPPYYSHQRIFMPSPVMSNRRLSRTAGEITQVPKGVPEVGRTATAPPLAGSHENVQNPLRGHRRLSPIYRTSQPQHDNAETDKITLGDMRTLKYTSPQTHGKASSPTFPSGGDHNEVESGSGANSSSFRTALQSSANEQNPDYTSKDLPRMKNSVGADQGHILNLVPKSINVPYLKLSTGELNDQPAQSDKFGAIAGIPIASKIDEPFTLVGTTGGTALRMNSLQSQSLDKDPVNVGGIPHVFKQGKICCITDEGTACSWHIGLGTTWLIFIGGVALGYFAQKHWPQCLPKAEPSSELTQITPQSSTPTPFPKTNPFKLQSAAHRNPTCHIRP